MSLKLGRILNQTANAPTIIATRAMALEKKLTANHFYLDFTDRFLRVSAKSYMCEVKGFYNKQISR
jgi:hypothetical protein